MKAAKFILLGSLGLLTWASPIPEPGKIWQVFGSKTNAKVEKGLAKRSSDLGSIAAPLTVRSSAKAEVEDEDVVYTDYKNKRTVKPEVDDEDVVYTDY
ncbi:MAG: hypothetical protein GOMPHAMPRED_004233 [Gomphillus americanus]|uniref:Uncharacterized protein n=1 Tax=Gomphillus americanus TaxID=1940652 RepID=A0A8H3IG58_9LECA|nr:MAG: hypothetical protein GOMPHAMPRED_004233 [Gomphillus americanus]